MLRSDTLADEQTPIYLENHLKSLDIGMIAQIQKEIEPCDMVSLVFLLYEVPDTALQRLIIYQRVSKDVGDDGSDLLHEWVLHVQRRPNWREEFLEALATCQLYSIIRKMGLDPSTIKRKYQCTNDTLILPMKKSLYRLCENMNMDNLHKLKKTLITYDIDVTDHERCELVILELLCRRFITIRQFSNQTQTKSDPGIESLARIIDNFPELVSFAEDLRRLENGVSHNNKLNSPMISSTPSVTVQDNLKKESDKKYLEEFNDVFELFNQLSVMKDNGAKNLKSDTFFMNKSVYEIKDPQNVGFCLIINQEKFHPSKESIEGRNKVKALDDRLGSTRDKDMLKQVMTNLKFEVLTRDNLDHKEMVQTIKDVIKYRVHKQHSIFMLCILSHGRRGHVFAADSVKVKVEYIESLLDSDDAIHLRDKPKIMILQACQVEDDDSYSHIVADSPTSPYEYYIKKSDIIIYWATAPNYEAYRCEQMGSIFIQTLCRVFQQYYKSDHFNDLCILVNNKVHNICTTLQREQLPKVEHTLMKKLFLQMPEK